MSEFIFVHLIDKRPVDTTLGRHIPLHMTILHWFESDHEVEEIVERTNAAVSSLAPIAIKATVEDLFGPDNNITVMKLNKDPRLVELHTTLMNAMEELGTTFDGRWTGASNWNPHVTNKQYMRLQPDDTVLVNDIDLITRKYKEGDRAILQRFILGSQALRYAN